MELLLQSRADINVTDEVNRIHIHLIILTRFNHTSLVPVVTPNDCPKSVRNRRLIGGVLVLSRLFLFVCF